jgi:hypothetical protein
MTNRVSLELAIDSVFYIDLESQYAVDLDSLILIEEYELGYFSVTKHYVNLN